LNRTDLGSDFMFYPCLRYSNDNVVGENEKGFAFLGDLHIPIFENHLKAIILSKGNTARAFDEDGLVQLNLLNLHNDKILDAVWL